MAYPVFVNKFLIIPGVIALTGRMDYNKVNYLYNPEATLKPGRKKVALTIVVLAVFAGLFYYYTVEYKKEKGPRAVETTGIVEGIETDVSPKISGKLVEVSFREGEKVKAGDLLAVLESEDLEAALRQSTAALSTAGAALANGYDAVRTARDQVEVARAGVRSAEAAVERSQAALNQSGIDLKRTEQLVEKGFSAKADLDHAQTDLATKKADLEQTKADLVRAKKNVTAAEAEFRQAEGAIPGYKGRIAEAKNAADFSRARLGYAKIYSPVDATVEYRTLEPGEVVSPGQSIMTLVDLSSLWVRIDLDEGYIAQVKTGQRAEITLERVPGKVFDGVVFDIGREGEFATERDVTRGRQDIKTFRTRIRVENPEGILKPGMTVLVKIPPQSAHSIKVGQPKQRE